MKATLRFDLEDPADRDAHAVALDGHKYRAVVLELDEHLRRRIKHGDDPEPIVDAIAEVRGKLSTLCAEAGLDPWD